MHCKPLTPCIKLGAKLKADGGQLIVTAPRGVTGADLAAAIRAHLCDIIKMLTDPMAALVAIYDEWCTVPTNASCAARYAQAAIVAGLGFTADDGKSDLGADG